MANSVILKQHTKGYLKDGRDFCIVSIDKVAVASDGSVHSGLVTLYIDGVEQTTMMSWLGENIDYDKVHNYEFVEGK